MKPATALEGITKRLYYWSSFHDQWKVEFHSYALKTADGVVFIDPMTPAPEVIKKLDELGEPLAVVLTNAHHERDSDWFRKHYEIQIYAHEKATSDCDTKIDLLVMDGEKLPGGLRAIYLSGITTSEMALFAKDGGGLLLLGDALLNPSGKGLQLLPEQFIEDRKQALQSLRKLLDLSFKTATFAHGKPIVGDAKKKIASFLKKPSR
jgi:glyoxylase-like metal-dependent hydrolase (beta-lactamase superfamily II)